MLFGTMNYVNDELFVGGVSFKEIKETYGTPTYVYDVAKMDEQVSLFKKHFVSNQFETTIVYASKAFLTKGMARYVNEQDLWIDAVSEGELFTILSAGFPSERIIFHGNNKSYDELVMALDAGVGQIVVDHYEELMMLKDLAERGDKKVKILLRLNPGIEAHTHDYIKTATLDSKFGTAILDTKEINRLHALIDQSAHIELSGYHCHIGSQIFSTEGFKQMIETVVAFAADKPIELLNFGGGFGVYYTKLDEVMPLGEMLETYVKTLETVLSSYELNIKNIMIEPGRAIVANAGSTLYEVGATKETYGGKDYIFIDGGMTDNIRPALYGAKYEAIPVIRKGSPKIQTIAGKCCESGDVIIRDFTIDAVNKGDLLVVQSTGAYGYSMASNYNRLRKPAVVFVKDGKMTLISRRETLEDVMRNDV